MAIECKKDAERIGERLLENIDWGNPESEVNFTVLGMTFHPNFCVGEMEVDEHSAGEFTVYIPAWPCPPKSIVTTGGPTLFQFERSMSKTLLNALGVSDNDWLTEFYTEVGLRHPVYEKVERQIVLMLNSIYRLSDDYALATGEEVIAYFDIFVWPRLREILDNFSV